MAKNSMKIGTIKYTWLLFSSIGSVHSISGPYILVSSFLKPMRDPESILHLHEAKLCWVSTIVWQLSALQSSKKLMHIVWLLTKVERSGDILATISWLAENVTELL
jgi:hypothetical protein